MLYKISAPGSMMLLGEHSVLYANPAVVFAVDRRIKLEIEIIDTFDILINSSLGHLKLNVSDLQNLDLQNYKSFQYVLTAIKYFSKQLTFGLKITIISDVPSTLGLGSSAAITSSMVAGLLMCISNKKPKNSEVFKLSKEMILKVQNRKASCADLAASIYGGIISYNMDPLQIESLDFPGEIGILAVYSGYKTPTPEVISIVKRSFDESPNIYKKIYEAMGECTKRGILAIKNKDFIYLGKIMNIYQSLLKALGVSDSNLEDLILKLQKKHGVIGTKISGSGLGDCIIGIGNVDKLKKISLSDNDLLQDKDKNIEIFPVNISSKGLVYYA